MPNRHVDRVSALYQPGFREDHPVSLARCSDIEILLRGGNLQFVRCVRLNFTTVEERPQFPAVRTVVHLNRGLTLESQLQAHLAGPLQFDYKRQLNLIGPSARKETIVNLFPLVWVWGGKGALADSHPRPSGPPATGSLPPATPATRLGPLRSCPRSRQQKAGLAVQTSWVPLRAEWQMFKKCRPPVIFATSTCRCHTIFQSKQNTSKPARASGSNRYSTSSPVTRKFPITTSTRSPRFTGRPAFEKTIQ